MTDEELRNEKHFAIDDYEQAYKQREACEARVSRIFQALEEVVRLHAQGVLRCDDTKLIQPGHTSISVTGVEYPSKEDVVGPLSSLEAAREREGAAKQRAQSAGANLDALRNI